VSKNVKIKAYRNCNFACYFVWPLTLREEWRWRVFENRVLRRMCRPKRGDILGGWRKLCNEELCNLHSSTHVIRTIKLRGMKWVGHLSCMGRIGMHRGFRSESQKERSH
jgi:hypothetical protein